MNSIDSVIEHTTNLKEDIGFLIKLLEMKRDEKLIDDELINLYRHNLICKIIANKNDCDRDKLDQSFIKHLSKC